MDRSPQKAHQPTLLLGAAITLVLSGFFLFWGIRLFRIIYPDAYSRAVLSRGDSTTIGPVERWMLVCREEWLICTFIVILVIFVVLSLGLIIRALHRKK